MKRTPRLALASAGERRLAHLKRLAPQIVTVKLDQVEGVQENVRVIAPVPEPVKRRHAVMATSNGLAINDAGARPQAGQGLNDQWEAPGEIIAGPAVEPHMVAVLPGDDPEAIVLDLVEPQPAGWRFSSFGWKARRDEAGRENTTRFEHGRVSKDGRRA